MELGDRGQRALAGGRSTGRYNFSVSASKNGRLLGGWKRNFLAAQAHQIRVDRAPTWNRQSPHQAARMGRIQLRAFASAPPYQRAVKTSTGDKGSCRHTRPADTELRRQAHDIRAQLKLSGRVGRAWAQSAGVSWARRASQQPASQPGASRPSSGALNIHLAGQSERARARQRHLFLLAVIKLREALITAGLSESVRPAWRALVSHSGRPSVER